MSKLGFIGLGAMGEPMALHLVKEHGALTVWNRSAEKCSPLADAGATTAPSVDALLSECSIIFFMLANAAALDAVVGRGMPDFASRVAGKTIVHMGTTSPTHSGELAGDVAAADGRYVEAPVSGRSSHHENVRSPLRGPSSPTAQF